MAKKDTKVRIRNPNPDWKKGREVLYVWVRAGLKKKIREESKAREIPMRKMISEIMERAIAQL